MVRAKVEMFVCSQSGSPGAAPEPAPAIEVEAPDREHLFVKAAEAIEERGLRVRALNFTQTGLLAYVEARP